LSQQGRGQIGGRRNRGHAAAAGSSDLSKLAVAGAGSGSGSGAGSAATATDSLSARRQLVSASSGIPAESKRPTGALFERVCEPDLPLTAA
jgi:hypothetical protein